MASDWEERQRGRALAALAQGRLLHITHGDCLDGMSCVGLVRRAFPDAAWIGIRPDETAKAIAWLEEAARNAVSRAPRGIASSGTPGGIASSGTPGGIASSGTPGSIASSGTPGGIASSGKPGRHRPRGRVLVTDLSLQGEEARALARRLAPVAGPFDLVWLDHHAPQWDPAVEHEMAGLARLVRIDRTGKDCAATLTLRWLRSLPREAMGAFRLEKDLFDARDEAAMAAVAHRDTFSDPDDPSGIKLGLASSRLRADYALLVEHGHYEALELLAEAPLRRRRRDLHEALLRLRDEPGGVATIFGPAPLSDLAHHAWPQSRARLILQFTDDGRLRIRSRPGFPLAQRLARRHGGGGHAYAAGATLVGRPWRQRVYRALRRHDPRVRRVLREARLLAVIPISAQGGQGRPAASNPLNALNAPDAGSDAAASRRPRACAPASPAPVAEADAPIVAVPRRARTA